ncbi:hypothetical protein [Methylovorus sp. MM2]|nr:hypothetical protein [Methylovorus sp. MM2]
MATLIGILTYNSQLKSVVLTSDGERLVVSSGLSKLILDTQDGSK